MIDSKIIIKALREQLQGDLTQLELSERTGVSRTYICELVSGKANSDGLTIGRLNALFPECVLDLHGRNVQINANNNSGNVVGVNNGKITADCMAQVMAKIIDASELSDSEKIKFMKVLKK